MTARKVAIGTLRFTELLEGEALAAKRAKGGTLCFICWRDANVVYAGYALCKECFLASNLSNAGRTDVRKKSLDTLMREKGGY